MTQQPVLACEGVGKTYGGLVALHNVSFSVDEGQFFAIIGPNGAGKTTLFDVISGITPSSGGTVRLAGRDIHGRRPHEICHLGMCRTFQTTISFSSQTVLSNVLVGSVFGRGKSKTLPWVFSGEAKDAAREALQACGLLQDQDHEAHSLPVLRRKKLMLATALACKPRVLLLDEPFGGLNPAERQDLIDLVQRLNKNGLTILMIEHIIEAVQTLAHRTLVLHHGEKLAEGETGEALSDPRVVEVYLGRRAAAKRAQQ